MEWKERRNMRLCIRGADYYRQSGGSSDPKPCATGGACLGGNWGALPGAKVVYRFKLAGKIEKPVVYLRYGRGFDEPAPLKLRSDGVDVLRAHESLRCEKTPGWGAAESDWAWNCCPLGPTDLQPGVHYLEMESTVALGQVNIDAVFVQSAGDRAPEAADILGALGLPKPVHFDETTGTVLSSRFGSGVPFGGFGTGKFELMTDGSLGQFTINHNWDNPIETASGSFFAVYAGDGATGVGRLLRLGGGHEFEGVANVQAVHYRGLAPRAMLRYPDAGLPVDVSLEAFSPLIPQNEKDSALPAAVFAFEVKNTSDKPVKATVLLSWENLLGMGGYCHQPAGEPMQKVTWDCVDTNYQMPVKTGLLEGVSCRTRQDYTDNRRNVLGEYLVMAEKAEGVAIATGEWNARADAVEFWNQFAATGQFPPIARLTGAQGKIHPAALVSATCDLQPGQARTLRFYVAWWMPNHVTIADGKNNGHFYLNHFARSTSLVEYVARRRERLYEDTCQWQDLILNSSLPFWFKLKLVNTVFTVPANGVYTEDGRFAIQESPVTMNGALGTMDQRMAHHGFYTQMFPALDKRELELFADCQQDDGRITHFCGNIHEVIGRPDVGYGITDWPDLTCSWVMQVFKLYRWTGDRAFLEAMFPRIEKAIAWLAAGDKDGDLVPEGGSTYDYEKAFGGMFAYSASCYLGALTTAVAAAGELGKSDLAKAYQDRLTAVRESVIAKLWNGKYFIKCKNPGGQDNVNTFAAALAGDWLARLSGLEATMPADKVATCLQSLFKLHLDLFPLVPPMEVTPAGQAAVDACYILQHEPFLGAEAIYAGFPERGMDVVHRTYRTAWLRNSSPWNEHLNYSVATGLVGMLAHYMTATSTWHILNALTGASLDIPNQTLFLNPQFPADWDGLECPVFFPSFWAMVSVDGKRKETKLRIIRTIGAGPTFTHLAKVKADGTVERTPLAEPFEVKTGKVLRMDN
jgi:uncharacterized protein (DUF608 family)